MRKERQRISKFCSLLFYFYCHGHLCGTWLSWPTKHWGNGERGSWRERGNPFFHSPLLFAPPSPTHNAPHTHLPSVQPQGVDDSRAGPFYVIGADGVQPPGGSRSHTELLSQQQSMNSSNLRRVLFYNLFDEWAYIFSWFPLTHIPVGGKTGGNFVYFSH